MDRTRIEWTDASWNPVTGCDRVSPGCDHCYAESIANRFSGTPAYPDGFEVTLRPDRLDQPLRWRRPRRVFVNSMSDLFHDSIPDEYVASVWAVMALAPEHTFQVLTKRHGRMRSLLSSDRFAKLFAEALYQQHGVIDPAEHIGSATLPLPNVWLGVSAENQQWADIRIPALLDTPAAVRFVSAEPLLGRIDLTGLLVTDGGSEQVDWVIVGGESGPGARPMHPDWARLLRDQCAAAGIAFFFKQRGEWTWNEPGQFRLPRVPLSDREAVMHPGGMTALTKSNPFDPFAAGHPDWATWIKRIGKKSAGRELDGRTWDEYPEAVAQ